MDEVGIWDRQLSATEVSQLAAGASIIPEPSATLMMLFGIAALADRRRR